LALFTIILCHGASDLRGRSLNGVTVRERRRLTVGVDGASLPPPQSDVDDEELVESVDAHRIQQQLSTVRDNAAYYPKSPVSCDKSINGEIFARAAPRHADGTLLSSILRRALTVDRAPRGNGSEVDILKHDQRHRYGQSDGLTRSRIPTCICTVPTARIMRRRLRPASRPGRGQDSSSRTGFLIVILQKRCTSFQHLFLC
jgi:hypothetical protein